MGPILLLFANVAASAAGPAFACPAPFVHDGDYIRCAGGRPMRLAAIDAPDFTGSPKCRPFARGGAVCDDALARASRDNLRALIAGRPVACRIVDASPDRVGFQAADRYGRPVVRCAAGGRDLGDAQRAGGFATQWPAPRS